MSAALDLDALDDLDWLESALVRANFGLFCEHVLAPKKQAPAAHHRLLIAALQDVADGRCKRLLVTMPPGSAKSTYVSVLFAAWYLGRAPRNVIGASHTMTLAERFSERAQAVVRDNGALLGCGLASENRQRWQTTDGGEYLAAGVGGAVTGFRADCAIIDDPVKSRQDADSETYRERTWEWYRADLLTRLKPGGSVVLVMTRWHQDDLAGRLLETERDAWRVVSLPALAEADDPLGRPVGAPLWADDGYGFGAALLDIRAGYERTGGMREWASLYQQTPRPPDGILFQTARIGVTDAASAAGRSVRAWDLAATAATNARDPDWTVGARLLRTAEDRYVVADVVRVRGGPEVVEQVIVATAQRDGRGVAISIPQDPGQAGKAQVAYLTSRLAGYTVSSTPETGDKETRARPLASQVNVGNVSIVRGPWNAALLDELGGFPAATHDDQVDALSRAFSALVVERTAVVQELGY